MVITVHNNIHYRLLRIPRFITVFKKPQVEPVLSQLNPIYIFKIYKIHLIITTPNMPTSRKLCFEQNFIWNFYFLMRAAPAHFKLLYLTTLKFKKINKPSNYGFVPS